MKKILATIIPLSITTGTCLGSIQEDNKKALLTTQTCIDCDLSGADLRDANLKTAQLNGANLTGADLRNANLTQAYLNNANLTDAKLDRVKLQGTNLFGAYRKEDPKKFEEYLKTVTQEWHSSTVMPDGRNYKKQ